MSCGLPRAAQHPKQNTEGELVTGVCISLVLCSPSSPTVHPPGYWNRNLLQNVVLGSSSQPIFLSGDLNFSFIYLWLTTEDKHGTAGWGSLKEHSWIIKLNGSHTSNKKKWINGEERKRRRRQRRRWQLKQAEKVGERGMGYKNDLSLLYTCRKLSKN